MIREIENVYKEKPLIRNLEYKIGLSLCYDLIQYSSSILNN